MKKILIISAIILLLTAVALTVYFSRGRNTGSSNSFLEEDQVRALVWELGSKMKNVPLLAPKDVLINSIKENYGPLVSPELLAAWEANPERAPGRSTSSPWPEKISIAEVEKDTDGSYTVQGFVIEVTNVASDLGGSQYPVALKIRDINGKLLITGFTKAIRRQQ